MDFTIDKQSDCNIRFKATQMYRYEGHRHVYIESYLAYTSLSRLETETRVDLDHPFLALLLESKLLADHCMLCLPSEPDASFTMDKTF
jgi:hypothetical protein